MKRLLFNVFFIFLMFNSSFLSAGTKKIYFFPLASSRAESFISQKYNKVLKDNLSKTEIFEIVEVENFNYLIKSDFGFFKTLRETVEKECEGKDYRLITYGYIKGYQIRIVLYSPAEKKVISEFKEMFYGDKNINESTKKCALKLATDLNTENHPRGTLISAAIPGLGHLLTGRYFRGTAYLVGFSYYLYKYATAGKKRFVYNDLEFREIEYYGEKTYLFNGNTISYEEWYTKRRDNYKNMVYNADLNAKKDDILHKLGWVYMINLVDTVVTDLFVAINSLTLQSKLEQRLSFNVQTSTFDTRFCISYRF